MHFSTDRIAHTTAIDGPVVDHWLGDVIQAETRQHSYLATFMALQWVNTGCSGRISKGQTSIWKVESSNPRQVNPMTYRYLSQPNLARGITRA